MLVLDENLPAAQRHLLRKWRIHFRVVGSMWPPGGPDDENLIPVLRRLAQPTFFSLDRRLLSPRLGARSYGWFGWMWRMTRRPNSSAGSCAIQPLTRKPSEWAR